MGLGYFYLRGYFFRVSRSIISLPSFDQIKLRRFKNHTKSQKEDNLQTKAKEKFP